MAELEWRTDCPDWEKRIVERRSLIPFNPLFPEQARSSLDVFESLRVADLPGVPTMGEVSREWIIDFVSHVFGSYDADVGRRMIQEFFLLISKKNTKSTTAAGIMLTALLWNWRESAEFLILAPTIEIANNSFYPARDMVRKDPVLDSLLLVQDHYRTITHRTTNATLKVVAADNETVGGKKATGVLVDELWLFGKRANAENMLREATGGLAARPEGFVIYLSTQSDEPPAGVFRQKLMYARGVRDGRIEDKRFLPVLYEFPQAMIDAGKHRDKRNFYITNPNLGASVDEEYLEREFQKARESGEESMCGFLAKHLNVEIGLAMRSDRWAGAEFWEKQGVKGLTLEKILDRSDVVVAGIDGGGLDDLLGLCVLGRERGTGNWLHWAHGWAHKIVLERRKEIAPALKDFEKQGDLTIVDLPGIDVAELADIICQIEERGLFPEKLAIGVDAAGIGDIIDELTSAERGITMEKIIGISQGWKLNGAIKTTERKIAGGELKHCGSKFMNWCIGNAKTEPKGNAISITKQASGTAKIDPLMATFNAVSLMSLNPDGQNIDDFIANPIKATMR
jgi:phage terminase large subunit-like protein